MNSNTNIAGGAGTAGTALVTRWLLAAGAASLLLRFFIAATFPITGDEAFFYWWGVYPDWGYSDHPPMVGWLIALTRATVGDSIWSIRLPVVLLPLGLGAALWWALKGVDRQRAAWAVLFFWLAPLNWLNMLITTDTPLIFWSVLSAASLMRAERRAQPDRAAYGLVLCAMPGPAINIAYNMSHGWSNIMFNVYNRNENELFELRKPLLYVVMMAYLITPAAVWMAFKHRTALLATASSAKTLRLLACLVVVPGLFFMLLSAKKVIGLHWVLSFYPFGFAFLAFALPPDKLKRTALGLAVFAGLHVLVVGGLYMTSLETWRSAKLYPQIIRSYKTAEIISQVSSPGVVLMADAYTPASIYGFERRQYMPVFGVGRFHARQDDMLVDFSLYRGKTIRIIHGAPPSLEEFKPFFEKVAVLNFVQNGVPFYVVEGTGFNYEAYRKDVLGSIFKRFYNIPAALPMTGCPFCERYCGQVRCP
jgi:Dolichyl-phosphate-mannose-protein mannosyltransferase